MIKEAEVVKVGKFQKTHALKGELNMLIDIDSDYFLENNPMIIDDDGILVPYYIESVRPKGSSSFLVKIRGIDNEEEASHFVNKDIYILKKDASEWFEETIKDTHELIGYEIKDAVTGRRIGVIENVDDTTSNILFVLKADNDEMIFVPANEDFITEFNENEKFISMNLPDGLLDLNKKE